MLGIKESFFFFMEWERKEKFQRGFLFQIPWLNIIHNTFFYHITGTQTLMMTLIIAIKLDQTKNGKEKLTRNLESKDFNAPENVIILTLFFL